MCGEDETMDHILRSNILNEGEFILENNKFTTMYTGNIQEKLDMMHIYKRNDKKRNNIIQNQREYY